MLYFKLFIPLLFSINLYGDNLVVIVSKDSSIDSISKKELSKIFLSKTKKLPNGQKALRVEINDEKIISKFYKSVSNKNQKRLKKYWTKMIFTGRGLPPKKLSSIDEIKQFIQNNPNAISYIPIKNLTNNLKVIMKVK